MAATDLFSDEHYDYLAPACDGEEVTPNDGTDLNFASRAIWVGGAGNLEVVMKGAKGATGATLSITGIPAGTLLPLAVTRIKSTGTTATGIVALY